MELLFFTALSDVSRDFERMMQQKKVTDGPCYMIAQKYRQAMSVYLQAMVIGIWMRGGRDSFSNSNTSLLLQSSFELTLCI